MRTILWRGLIGLVIGLAVLVVSADAPRAIGPTRVLSPASLSLSRDLAAPDTTIQLAGLGFRPYEAVTVQAIDPIGTATVPGQVYADGYGRVAAAVAPTEYATNGVNALALIGTKSGANVTAPLTLIGCGCDELARWSGDANVATQRRWRLLQDTGQTCQQCLLVHGQTP